MREFIVKTSTRSIIVYADNVVGAIVKSGYDTDLIQSIVERV